MQTTSFQFYYFPAYLYWCFRNQISPKLTKNSRPTSNNVQAIWIPSITFYSQLFNGHDDVVHLTKDFRQRPRNMVYCNRQEISKVKAYKKTMVMNRGTQTQAASKKVYLSDCLTTIWRQVLLYCNVVSDACRVQATKTTKLKILET